MLLLVLAALVTLKHVEQTVLSLLLLMSVLAEAKLTSWLKVVVVDITHPTMVKAATNVCCQVAAC